MAEKNNKFGFLLTAQVKDTRPRGDKHEAEYCLDLVRHLGVDARDLTLSISIKQTHEDWVQQFLNDSGVAASGQLIAVHPGASCISKRWPAKNFAALMNAVTEKYPFNIVLIGNSSNRFIADEIKQAVPRPVIDAVGKTSVGQLASLLKRCALLVSNDSGPVHVASAVGTPVISIFGRNQAGLSPARWRPLGKDAMVFHKEVGCGVCLAHNCAIGFLCLEKITPGEVMEAVTALLSSNNRMP